MIWLYKVKNWVIAHKNWLVLMAMFVISYLVGKKANKNYLEMAKLAKDQYKKENEEIQRLQKEKQVRDKKANEKSKAVKAALEAEKQRKLDELQNKNANIDDVFQNIGIKKK